MFASWPSTRVICVSFLLLLFALSVTRPLSAQQTSKPVLHGKHWVAITGKPRGAVAGAKTFEKGGNAVDAAAAMLAVTATMWDVLGWGGETQALIYNPDTGKVVGINALGVAPSGATPAFFQDKGMRYPPEYGPLAAVTPGTPGGLMTMVAEYGTLSLAEVLQPAIEMAEGYPIEASAADNMERRRDILEQWPTSRAVFLPHYDAKAPDKRAAPRAGDIFVQSDLTDTLRKLVEAEKQALARGKTRKEAIYAAYERFYRGDIAEEIVKATRASGGLFTKDDLANWEVKIEEPVSTNYRGVDVYKLTTWTQGPVLLQTLNILEGFDLKAMGYNSKRYIHTLYQAMNLAFADRDFYYGDPYAEPAEPIDGLLSKDYAAQRRKLIDTDKNLTEYLPGDPYPFQSGKNPFEDLRQNWKITPPSEDADGEDGFQLSNQMSFEEGFQAGTTAIQAADAEGWVVSVTPSGGWIPAFIAGNTGIGLSQRMQSFVLDKALNPYNVVAPGKRPRVTLTPSMALKDGKPLVSFSVQGGDLQDQNMLQFFLGMMEWDMNVQQAAEGKGNFISYQMQSSFGAHDAQPGRIQVATEHVTPYIRTQLREMGYAVEEVERVYNPTMGIWFNSKNDTMQGGASDQGDDYGIAW